MGLPLSSYLWLFSLVFRGVKETDGEKADGLQDRGGVSISPSYASMQNPSSAPHRSGICGKRNSGDGSLRPSMRARLAMMRRRGKVR